MFLKAVGEEERCQNQPLQDRAAVLGVQGCPATSALESWALLLPPFHGAGANLRHLPKPRARAGAPHLQLLLSLQPFEPSREPLARGCGSGQARPPSLPWLNILPVSSPAVLGCCSRQPLPRRPPSLAGKAWSRLPGLSPEPPPQPVTFTASPLLIRARAPGQSQGRGSRRSQMAGESCRVSFQGKARLDFVIFFFQNMNLFNVFHLEVPALEGLWEGAAWQGRCSCPGSGFTAVGFQGCFLLFLSNKALKWKWIRCFYYCINIHSNSLQKLTHFSS